MRRGAWDVSFLTSSTRLILLVVGVFLVVDHTAASPSAVVSQKALAFSASSLVCASLGGGRWSSVATTKAGVLPVSSALSGAATVGQLIAGRRGIKTILQARASTLAFATRAGALRSLISQKGRAQQHFFGLRGGFSMSASASETTARKMATLETLHFDNSFVRDLPSDPLSNEDKVKNNRPRQIQEACYSLVLPKAVKAPTLVSFSKECAELINLPEEECRRQKFADILAGNELFPGSEPMAMCYGGHQFGNWAGQLGDGRAMSLGEVINAAGDRWELQLKGAGPTPYSRTADGRAVLRSSVREYLCSEAMYHLGVPTTRALSLVLTGDQVVRDMFYDGNAAPEPGAVVCRVAPSFIRFGNFEIFASRGDEETLKKILDFTLHRDFPAIAAKHSGPEAYLDMLKEVCRTTAIMIAHWMRVGYVHGVMNTDNMSILGLTIDYGPYGWIDNYDPEWTPNTTDGMRGRYKFGNQPGVALWNLVRLANAMYPAIGGSVDPIQEALGVYEETLTEEMNDTHRRKLGFKEWKGESDEALFKDLAEVMVKEETDMTIFFRLLANVPIDADEDKMLNILSDAFYKPLGGVQKISWAGWLAKYAKRVKEDGTSDADRKAVMDAANPKYVLRNYIAQNAIDKAADGDFTLVDEVLEVMRRPYDEQPEREAVYFAKRPDWARTKPGCSALSCSS